MFKAGRTEFCHSEAGYTYAGLLIVLVGLGLAAQATMIPPATTSQREAETELIHRGLAYAHAIESYWMADPETPEFPPSLDALLDDPRKDGRRHMRRLVEPVIAEEWQVIRSDEGGIAGVAPASDRPTFKRAGFPPAMTVPETAKVYSDWHFVFDPEAASSSP